MPSSIRKFKNKSIFIKLLAFFILLLVLSVFLVGYSSYLNSSKLLIDEVKNHNILVLKQVRDGIDQKITLLNNTTLQVAIDKRVKNAFYMRSSIDAETIILSDEITKYLSSIKSSTGFIDSIFLYFNRSDMIVTDDGKYDLNTFINNIYSDYKWTKEKWMEIFNNYTLFKTLDYYDLEDDVVQNNSIIFIRSLPIETRSSPNCTIAVNINRQELLKSFGNYDERNNISYYIIDSKGNIIIGTENNDGENSVINDNEIKKYILDESDHKSEALKDISVKGEDYSIAVIGSQNNDWKYVSIIPTRYITERTSVIKDVMVGTIAVSILLGLLLSFMLTRNIYNPINKIINYIEIIRESKTGWKSEKCNDEMSLINRFIDLVFHENKNLTNVINESIPMLREKFLGDLLDGKLSCELAQDSIYKLDFDMPFDSYQVLVFEIDDYSEPIKQLLERFNEKVVDIVEQYSIEETFYNNIRAYSLEKSDGKTVCLINIKSDYEKPEIVYDIIHKVTGYFNDIYKITFTVGVGKVYHNMKDITTSYIECLFALKYMIIEGQNRIINIDEVSTASSTPYDYSVECEKKIINLVKAGDYSGVKDVLQSTLKENIEKKDISPETLKNLFAALAGTAVRTVNDVYSTIDEIFGEGYSIYEGLNESISAHQSESFLLSIFKRIIDYINDRRKSKNEELYSKITDYITQNYHEDISLNMAGDSIGLTPSYLSWVFKEITGRNFVDYLNGFRIEKAKQLLKESNISVAKVGEKVGFTNSNTFIRVFKKYEGITPGNYRSCN